MPSPEEVYLDHYLAADQSAYFAVNVADNQDLFHYIAGELEIDVGAVIGRINHLAGSYGASGVAELTAISDSVGETDPAAMPRLPVLVVVASGNIPAGGTRFVLWKERDFKRTVGEVGDKRVVYFRQRSGMLEIAPIKDNLIIVTSGSVLSHLARVQPEEEGSMDAPPRNILDPYTTERIRAVGEPDAPDSLLVFTDPAMLLVTRGVEVPGFPIQGVTLGALLPTPTHDEEESVGELRGELTGELLLSTAREAALFGRLSRLFVLGLVRSLGLDSSDLRSELVISVEDRKVAFRGIPVSVDQLVLLLRGVTEVP